MKPILEYFSSNKKISLISEYLMGKAKLSSNNMFSYDDNMKYIYDKIQNSDIDASLLTKYEDCLEKLVEFGKSSVYLKEIPYIIRDILEKPEWEIFTGQKPNLKTVKFEYLENEECSYSLLSISKGHSDFVCITIGGIDNKKSIKLYITYNNKAAATLYYNNWNRKCVYWAHSWNNVPLYEPPTLMTLNEDKINELYDEITDIMQ